MSGDSSERSAGGTGGQGGDLVGLLVVDKEPGWTSHDVVARCRKLFGQRRVGHAGTLDPDATGVLLVGLGRFTRLLRFLASEEKSYDAEVVLGTATTTLDSSGEVLGSWDMSTVTLDDVRQEAAKLTGQIEQVPPMVSAVKVGGRRLHALARAGLEVERASRSVTVHRFDVSAGSEAGTFRIAVDCSAGTYVRVLAADLGHGLGGGAHLRHLRRTRVGRFSVAEAHQVAELEPALVIDPARALEHLQQLSVEPEVARRVTHGLALDRVALGAGGEGPWALVDGNGRLLAVYERTDTHRMVALCVLSAAG
jgi:tRNA pseudouridine55 synthase